MSESFMLAVVAALEKVDEKNVDYGNSKTKDNAIMSTTKADKYDQTYSVELPKHLAPNIPRPQRNISDEMPIVSVLADLVLQPKNKLAPKPEEDENPNESIVNKTVDQLILTRNNEVLPPSSNKVVNIEPISPDKHTEVKTGDRNNQSTADSNMVTAENKPFLPNVSDKEIVKSDQAVHSMNHKRTLKPEKIIDSSSYISESTKRTNALRTREKQTISAYRFQENKKTRQDRPVKSRDKIYHKPPRSPRITRNKILRTLPKPSIDLNQSKSEIVAASTDTRSLKTLGIKEKRPKERRTKHSNLPKDIQGIIARRILTDSSNESQDNTANSNTGEFKNAKPQKPRRQDVTRSTISSKRKQKECKQFQSAPSLQNEKKIKKAPMNEEKLKPIHNPKLIMGNAISRANDQEEKEGKKEAEEAHARERGRSRTRRTRYDAMNSSTKLILLNNKCPDGCSRLWSMRKPPSSAERSQIIDPLRHLKETSFYMSGGFHKQCSRTPSRESFRSNSSINSSLNASRAQSTEHIGDRLYEARHSVNPHRHRVCRPLPRSASMDFSRPKRTDKVYVFEWERIYAERPASNWSRRKSASLRSSSVQRGGGSDVKNDPNGIIDHHKRAWVTDK